MSEFPQLERPPISEVVVGFVFEPMALLTSAMHGVYWHDRRSDFPKHEIHVAVSDIPTVIWEGAAPQRTWLASADETRLIQLQNDRFFVNWRRRQESDEYPRFSARGDRPGLLPFALGEFDWFRRFCAQEKLPLALVAVELTKIDLLVQGTHWTNLHDLGAVLPMTAALSALGSDAAELALKMTDVSGDILTVFALASGMERATKNKVIRLETRARLNQLRDDKLETHFTELNRRVNDVFFRSIPADQLRRFGVR